MKEFDLTVLVIHWEFKRSSSPKFLVKGKPNITHKNIYLKSIQ